MSYVSIEVYIFFLCSLYNRYINDYLLYGYNEVIIMGIKGPHAISISHTTHALLCSLGAKRNRVSFDTVIVRLHTDNIELRERKDELESRISKLEQRIDTIDKLQASVTDMMARIAANGGHDESKG